MRVEVWDVHTESSVMESVTMRRCCLNSESNDSSFVNSFWAWPKAVESLTFVLSSDKRTVSFVMEAFVTPLLRQRAVVVGSMSDISIQILCNNRMSSFKYTDRWHFNLFQSRGSNKRLMNDKLQVVLCVALPLTQWSVACQLGFPVGIIIMYRKFFLILFYGGYMLPPPPSAMKKISVCTLAHVVSGKSAAYALWSVRFIPEILLQPVWGNGHAEEERCGLVLA